MPGMEVHVARPDPDGLTRLTARFLGSAEVRSWLVPSATIDDYVLDEWAEDHRRRLGFPPVWSAGGADPQRG